MQDRRCGAAIAAPFLSVVVMLYETKNGFVPKYKTVDLEARIGVEPI